MRPAANKSRRPNHRRTISFISAILISTIIVVVFALPQNEPMLSPEPMNPGHEELVCDECHLKAKGSTRQQLQANLQHFLGNRAASVSVGHKPVNNEDCLACHRRAKDNHPVFRFFEPRFSKARRDIDRICDSPLHFITVATGTSTHRQSASGGKGKSQHTPVAWSIRTNTYLYTQHTNRS